MKKNKIILSMIFAFFIILTVLVITVRSNFRNEIKILNQCYEQLQDCAKNGFNKELAEDNKKLFEKALKIEIESSHYEESNFNNSDITFSTISYLPWNDSELDVYHSRDLILAMYLTCVLSTEPENLENELQWFVGGTWLNDARPEFANLINAKYDLSKEELDVIVDSFYGFIDSLENDFDKWHTMAWLQVFIADYDQKHPNSQYDFNYNKQISQTKFYYSNIDVDDKYKHWIGFEHYVEGMY